jgi:hypothetical protein
MAAVSVPSKAFAAITCLFVFLGLAGAGPESEVRGIRDTKPVVKVHPKTGKPYVSIVSTAAPQPDPLAGVPRNSARPDYRLLDPGTKPGEVPYEGPYSDRRRVYLFAAALMTVGTVGGAVGIAAAPVSAGAATGGGAYVAAGSAVAGSASAAAAISQRRPPDEEFKESSESKTIANAEEPSSHD